MIISRDTIFTLDADIKDPAKIILFLRTLINTPVGSVELDRDFGIDMSMLDLPLPIAQAMLSSEVVEKIAKYIPDIQASEVLYHIADPTTGEMRMEVKIKYV